MPTRLNRAIAAKLQVAQVAITNSRTDPALAAAATTFGYGPERLLEAKALYDTAVAAVDAATLAWAAQKAATARVRTARKAAEAARQTLAKTARILFDDAVLTALGVNQQGGMPRRFEEFLMRTRAMFEMARMMPEISGPLAAHGLGAEWLDRAAESVEALSAIELEQTAVKADRLRATGDQTRAVQALTVWVATYIKIARIALQDQPALLEKIGVKVRVGRSAAQVAGRQKAAATRKANRAARETK